MSDREWPKNLDIAISIPPERGFTFPVLIGGSVVGNVTVKSDGTFSGVLENETIRDNLVDLVKHGFANAVSVTAEYFRA